MQYIEPFKHVLPCGTQVIIEAEVDYHPAISTNKHTAASRDDLQDHLEVHSLNILSVGGTNLTGLVDIPDNVLIRELELTYQDEQANMMELTWSNIYDEAENYYGDDQ